MLKNLEAEVQRVMQHTNGCISWRRLAEQIAGGEKNVQPIGPDALSTWVMGTEGFRYTETQTLPQCTTERTKNTQGLNNRGLYLTTEKLRELLQKGWNEYPEEKIARLFVHQTQVAAAILQCNGGDEFVQERNG